MVVRVEATGVCRSDWHAWRGHDPVPLPMVPGHELAGIVHEVGPEVTGWSVGDRVTVPFVLGCGRCALLRGRGSRTSAPTRSSPGSPIAGSWAELVAVPAADANVVRLPDDVDMVAAASLGCRFATSFRALVTHGQVGDGDTVAVHGCGGAGLSAVMIAKALGARVVAVDVGSEARRRAAELGADDVVDPAEHPDVAARRPPADRHRWRARLRRRRRLARGRRRLGRVACAVVAGTSRWGCCSVRTPGPRCRWTWSSPSELQVLGSHGMPAGDYPGDARADRLAATSTRAGWSGEVVGLDAAPAALMAMDDPSVAAGMTVIRLT